MQRETPIHPDVAADFILQNTALRPRVALVLGSGFQKWTSLLNVEHRFRYHDLPGFRSGSVPGHGSELLTGTRQDLPLAVLSGRIHYYEGFSMEQMTFPIRVLAALGIETLLLTNAAGAIRPGLEPGHFMVITDHINAMGANPLRGPEWPGRDRFVDLSRAYDVALCDLLVEAGRNCDVPLHRGVYVAVSGPSYETPAEIRAFSRMGADAVGMSTVPETIVARQCGLRVAGVSCLTNLAAGVPGQTAPLSHEEVLTAGVKASEQAGQLIDAFLDLYRISGSH
jgi:purine-nucleoside phosphorylase